MTVIHEIQQVIWVDTPLGHGCALFLIDYGPHENTVWVVALQKTREVKHFNSNQVKVCYNHTFDINNE
jgi:hypothetical protein